MKNKKVLLGVGVGALILVLVGGLIARDPDLFQGKVRNVRLKSNAPQVISTPDPVKLPTVNLLVDGGNGPALGGMGIYNVVSWSSTYAASCSIVSAPFVGNFSGISGSHTFNNVIADITFTATCTGVNGGQASDSVTISPPPAPIVDLLINGGNDPATVELGDEVVLSWTSTNAKLCFGSMLPASQDNYIWNQTATSGSLSITMIWEAKTFKLSCTNEGGVERNDSVTANAVPSS